MKVSIYMGMSLDGFISRTNDALDFLPEPPDGDDLGFTDFLASVDLIVMGRRTFDVVLSFGRERWPYGATRLVVLSRRWTSLPDGVPATVSLAQGTPAEVVRDLEASGATHVYVDGGETARSFLAAGLVDQIDVTHVPVLIGDGMRVWGPLPHDVKLELIDSRVRAGGLVQSRYRVGRAAEEL